MLKLWAAGVAHRKRVILYIIFPVTDLLCSFGRTVGVRGWGMRPDTALGCISYPFGSQRDTEIRKTVFGSTYLQTNDKCPFIIFSF